MRAVFCIYWLIGCWMLGGAVADRMKACPNDDWPVGQPELITVTIWPAAFIAALHLPNDHKFPPRKCEQP